MRPALRAWLLRSLLALMWLWLGATSFTELGSRILSGHVGAHALLGTLGGSLPPRLVGVLIGSLQLTASALVVLPARWKDVRRAGAFLSASLAFIPLTLLFSNPVWMESLGGFPAIGSGQGLLKYASVVGLSIHLAGIDGGNDAMARRGMHLTVAGLMLPLLWIGGMKFTLPEARGIEGLLASSPLFSWMGAVFSVQGASNVIGITELVTVGFLATYWFKPRWAAVGGLLGTGTFLATLSFLVTAPGWHPELGFPRLGGGGVFLVKDLALLAASAAVATEGIRRSGAVPGAPRADPAPLRMGPTSRP